MVLTEPKIETDFLLLDEAQDTNPVLEQVFTAQRAHAQLVMVGDSAQAIYGWRGARDVMSGFPDGSGRVVDLPTGPPLGLGSLPFEAVDLDIPDGSVLALFTDGLVTSREGDFDEDLSDLQRALAQPARSLDALCDSVLASMCTQPRTDDVALLLARTKRLSEDQVADWAVPPDPAAVATIRREVVDRLAAWHLEAAAFAPNTRSASW